MPWSLDWFSAEVIAKEKDGNKVRRVSWTNKWLIYNHGVWCYTDEDGFNPVVVSASDSSRADLEARDWTDQPFNADICGATPFFNVSPPKYMSWTFERIVTPPPPPGFSDPE